MNSGTNTTRRQEDTISYKDWYVWGNDIETRFAKPEVDDGTGLLLSAFCYDGEEVIVIDNTSVSNNEIFPVEILKRSLFIAHNADFEARWGVRTGFVPGRYVCTMVNDKRLLSGQTGYHFDLISCINRRLGYEQIPEWMEKDIRSSFKDCTFFNDNQILYNAADTIRLKALYFEQLRQAAALDQLYLHNTINSRLIIPIAEAEITGIRHNSARWVEIAIEKQKKATEICQSLNKIIFQQYHLDPELVNPKLKEKRLAKEKKEAKNSDRKIKLLAQKEKLEKANKTHQKNYKITLEQLQKIESTTPEQVEEDTGPINWNSDKQVLTALSLIGCPLPTAKDRETHKMKEGVSKEARANWFVANEGSPFMPLMETYEKLMKLQHVIDSFGQEWVNNYVRNGRAYTLLDQAGTTTGRFSSGSKARPGVKKEYMNIQQIPVRDGTEYRDCFIADEGRSIITADYSNCEGSVMASLAKDLTAKKIMDMKDSHSFLGTKAWRAVYLHRYNRTKKEEWKVLSETYEMNKSTPEKSKERDTFKNSGGLFPVMYGVAANKVAATSKITDQEGQAMIDTVKAEVPITVTYLDTKSKEASTQGYVIHNTRTNSRRWFTPVLDNIKYGFPLSKSDKISAEMEGRNTGIQGTNSDIMKEAIIMVNLWCRIFKQDLRFLLTAHDEGVWDCPTEQEQFYMGKVKEIMKRAAKNYLIREISMDVDVRLAAYWKK